ncbi:hypothetical protein F5Y16DRAFT_369035 [Xylariaceae sp. FL0255]|nr:hypothetical protein F5Y16DRAFT_369035 [Xylariaceae sp. FL0255]
MMQEREKRQRYQSELTGIFNTTSYVSLMNANNLYVKDTCEMVLQSFQVQWR